MKKSRGRACKQRYQVCVQETPMPPKYLEAMVNAYDLLHRGRIECYVSAEHDTLYPTPNPATIGRAYLASEAVLPSSRNRPTQYRLKIQIRTWVMSEDTVPMHCENTTAPGGKGYRVITGG